MLKVVVGIFLFLALIVGILFVNKESKTLTITLPSDAKRIVFIGDSITYSGQYVAYIEA